MYVSLIMPLACVNSFDQNEGHEYMWTFRRQSAPMCIVYQKALLSIYTLATMMLALQFTQLSKSK